MVERSFTIPDIAMMAGTRVALGIGIGLLLSGRLNRDSRKGAGVALVVIGALTTIPIFLNVRGKPSLVERQAA